MSLQKRPIITAAAARLLAAKARTRVSSHIGKEWDGSPSFERFLFDCEMRICRAIYDGQNEVAVEVFSLEKAKYIKSRLTENGYQAKIFYDINGCKGNCYHLLTIKW